MRKILIFLIAIILVTSAVSAEIIIREQPQEIYNLGEAISIPTTIKSTKEIIDVFQMDLLCEGHELNFYKNGIALSTGQEKQISPSLILSPQVINNLKGSCVIKAILGEDYVLTNEFTISSLANTHAEIKTPEIIPGESIIVQGGSTKESGKNMNGFVEAKAYLAEAQTNNSLFEKIETINNGFFSLNISTTEKTKAGEYVLEIKVYEKNSLGEITNEGTTMVGFSVLQKPSNLKISLEEEEIEPGKSAVISLILQDQTGENIPSNSTLKIKNSEGKIIDSTSMMTDGSWEFSIPEGYPPTTLQVTGKSGGLEAKTNFTVIELADISTKIINGTLVTTNTGNVPYCNKTILVKIENQSLDLDTCLGVGEEERYELSAPDGEYKVEIITDEETTSEIVPLTGKAIDVKKASQGIAQLSRYPFIWIFVIAIFGFLALTVYKKGYKNTFIGKKLRRKKKPQTPDKEQIITTTKNKIQEGPLVRNTATLALSIKGEKQRSGVICLKINNVDQIKSNKETTKETLSKLNKIAEEQKSMVYENQGNIFFILAPSITRTFKHESPMIEISQKIKSLLDYHNKLFKQKIDYGISVSEGEIVAKNQEIFKFMPLGNLMQQSKKLATLSKEEILISQGIRDKLGSNIKAEKKSKENTVGYKITEMKEKGKHDKFIKNFLERLDK